MTPPGENELQQFCRLLETTGVWTSLRVVSIAVGTGAIDAGSSLPRLSGGTEVPPVLLSVLAERVRTRLPG